MNMQFRISWTDSKHGQESLAFGEEAPHAGSAPPSAVIYGRRFYLQSTCHDVSVIQKVIDLQPFIFSSIEQFARALKATSPLLTEDIAIQWDFGDKKFLEKTIPQIEAARIQNQNLLAQNPYFRANSVSPGMVHPLYFALFQRNHALLAELCKDPHLLLINEKTPFLLLDGSQMMASPLEMAILNNDLESAKIILSAPALNREIPFPKEALKRLGVDKASPFIQAYISMRPNLIEAAYVKSNFEELRKDGFLERDIERFKEYYATNLKRDGMPRIIDDMLMLIRHPAESALFKHCQRAAWSTIKNPLTNYDAVTKKNNPTVLLYILGTIKELFGRTPSKRTTHPENVPYVKEMIMHILKTGQYTINDLLFSYFEELPKELFDTIPQDKIEAYKKEKYLPSANPNDMRAFTPAHRALCTRENLVTLLGKTTHESSLLKSSYQAPKWVKKLTFTGGNTPENFKYLCYALFSENLPFSIELTSSVKLVLSQFMDIAMLQHQYSRATKECFLIDNEQNHQRVHRLTEWINHAPLDIKYLSIRVPRHTQSLLFWQGYYITCDRREITNTAKERVDGACIKIYTHPSQVLSEQLLWHLLSANSESNQIIRELSQKEPMFVGGKCLHEILIKPQKHLNCTWASNIAPAIQVAFQLFTNPETLLKEGRFDQKVLEEMKHFNHFAKSIAIQDYVTAHQRALEESPGTPDSELTGKALFYALYKCALKDGDEHYVNALDKLVYSGFAVSSEPFKEYSAEEQEKMKRFLEERYSLKGIREHMGYAENISDAEAFLAYLANPLPSTGNWPQYLLS